MLSIPHLIIIFLVALVVLGPEKLPQVARVLGKAMADFRRITTDFRVQIEDEMQEMERQARLKKEAAVEAVPYTQPQTHAAIPPLVTTTETPVTEAPVAEASGSGPSAVELAAVEPPMTEPPVPAEPEAERAASERAASEPPATEKRADGDFHTA